MRCITLFLLLVSLSCTETYTCGYLEITDSAAGVDVAVGETALETTSAPGCTLSQVVAASALSSDLHDGVTFILDAPLFTQISCTTMSCSESDPCCNYCGGDYIFTPGDALAGSVDYCTLSGPDGVSWGCQGDDCDTSCTPFGEPGSDEPLEGKLLLGTLEIKGALCEFEVIEVCQ